MSTPVSEVNENRAGKGFWDWALKRAPRPARFLLGGYLVCVRRRARARVEGLTPIISRYGYRHTAVLCGSACALYWFRRSSAGVHSGLLHS